MCKTDILFIFPKYEDVFNNLIGTGYHIGTAYIRAFLAEHDITSAQFISEASKPLAALVDVILKYDAPIIGFSCYDKSFFINKLISSEIKKRNPEVKIIFGGPTPSFSDSFVMKNNPVIDVCVREEGEVTLLELVRRWKENKEIGDILGITYRDNGQIKRSPDRPQLSSGEKDRELDFLPSPYLSGMLPIDPRTAALVSARGCPYKCTFCNNSIMGRHKIRRHSIDRILEELEYISLNGEAKEINVTFVDDAFTLDVERAKRICKQIAEKKFANLQFGCQTRIDRADEELFSLFVQAGFNEVSFGLDSASPRVLNKIKKVRTQDGEADDYKRERDFLERYRKSIKLAQAQGLKTYVSIILGLPTETPKEAYESLDFVKEIEATHYSQNILKVFTGTELSHTIDQYGIKKKTGPFLLPYIVEHTFDVYDIPHLDNSMSQSINMVENYKDHNNFTKAIGALEQTVDTEAPRQIILSRVSTLSDQLCRWLGQTVALDTFVCFFNDQTSPGDYEKRIWGLANYGVPLVKYVQVRQAPLDEADPVKKSGNRGMLYKLNDFMPEFRQGGYYSYYILPFQYAPDKDKQDKEILIRKIDSYADIDAFLKEMISMMNSDSFDFFSLNQGYYLLEDKCRWSQCLCHASALKRLIIDEKECVRPCIKGEVIGSTSDSIAALREKIKQLEEVTRKRRGCDECEVRFVCSQCLFLPEFLAEKEYCELRRRYQRLHKAVEIMEIAYRLMLQLKNKRLEQVGDTLELKLSGLNGYLFNSNGDYNKNPYSPTLTKDYILLRLGRSYFLYNIKQTRLLRINDKMAAIFEVLENQAYDTEHTTSWLADKFSILPHDADNLLKKALDIFREADIISSDRQSPLNPQVQVIPDEE
jgi:anaerobic magnesium-protoporphyrin IX monomethyl ester cyclase